MQINSNKLDDRKSGTKISLRPAGNNDCKIIWKWANDPVSRSASFSSEMILWEDHSKWFELKLRDPNCIFFVIVQNSILLPVGTIRYETEKNNGVISINIAPNLRERGIGSQAILISSELLFQTTSVEIIHAFIKTENAISIRAFTKSGYNNSGLVKIRGNLAYDYTKTKPTRIVHDK